MASPFSITNWIQNLFSSRDNNVDPSTFVGQEGRIWYNPVTNAFYVSDGRTPGGIIIQGGGGGGICPQLDGGSAESIYLTQDQINGGSAASVYTPSQVINGGTATSECG